MTDRRAFDRLAAEQQALTDRLIDLFPMGLDRDVHRELQARELLGELTHDELLRAAARCWSRRLGLSTRWHSHRWIASEGVVLAIPYEDLTSIDLGAKLLHIMISPLPQGAG